MTRKERQKLADSLNPFRVYIRRIFSDPLFDLPDPKYSRRPLSGGLKFFLSYKERLERDLERWDMENHDYPFYKDDFRRYE